MGKLDLVVQYEKDEAQGVVSRVKPQYPQKKPFLKKDGEVITTKENLFKIQIHEQVFNHN